MGKRKIRMEFISKWSVRASTFRKRKASLFKKAKELATLCGVDVSLVVAAGPDDSAPEVWPSLEAVSNMASRANDFTTNDKHIKTKARQVADIQVELKNLEMENLAMEAELFLEETLSGRSQVAEVASSELAMRLWAMLEIRKMTVDDRINSLLSLQVPLHSAAPHVWGFSDVPDETGGLFSDLPANMAYTSQLCGAEWMQIDGGPLSSAGQRRLSVLRWMLLSPYRCPFLLPPQIWDSRARQTYQLKQENSSAVSLLRPHTHRTCMA